MDILGFYANRGETDQDYLSDGERGQSRGYKSSLFKKDEKAKWAVMYNDPDQMFEKYKSIVKSVSLNTGVSLDQLEKDFKETIFESIAKAYIGRIPGKIITTIYNDRDYLTQHHPSKSINVSYGKSECELRLFFYQSAAVNNAQNTKSQYFD